MIFIPGGCHRVVRMTERAATEDLSENRATPGYEELEHALEQHRAELTAYSYRMLGSAFEAEDAVQETLLRAWRSFDGFEGRAALRSWLYRIATNVCLDMLNGRQRRARPMDLGPARTAVEPLGDALPEATWIQPIPDGRVMPADADPAEVAEMRESIRLAFIAALQHLPPRQRAVLILREVLRWKATEVAELLDTTVASVNSALQRARAALAAGDVTTTDSSLSLDDEQRALLARYVDAFERYDLDSLTSLLHEDATWSMPPYELWLQSHLDIRRWCLGPGIACRGSRLIPTVANGAPAFGQYKPGGPGGSYEPWSLQVLEISGGRIAGISFFLDTATLFPLFGLPPRLER
jgi:RNA polymerase sigma-70 factor (ECF subfamily)